MVTRHFLASPFPFSRPSPLTPGMIPYGEAKRAAEAGSFTTNHAGPSFSLPFPVVDLISRVIILERFYARTFPSERFYCHCPGKGSGHGGEVWDVVH